MAAESAATWVPMLFQRAHIMLDDAKMTSLTDWMRKEGYSLDYLAQEDFFEEFVEHLSLRNVPKKALRTEVKKMAEGILNLSSPPERCVLKDNTERPPSMGSAGSHRSRSPPVREAGLRDPEPALHSSQHLCSVHNKGRSKSHVELGDNGKWRCKQGEQCVMGKRDPTRDASPRGRPIRTKDISRAMSYALRYPSENLPSMYRVPPALPGGKGGIILRDFQESWADQRNISENEVKSALGIHLFKSPSPPRGHRALRFAVGIDPASKRVMISSPDSPRARR